jgi:hypothetical protein
MTTSPHCGDETNYCPTAGRNVGRSESRPRTNAGQDGKQPRTDEVKTDAHLAKTDAWLQEVKDSPGKTKRPGWRAARNELKPQILRQFLKK